RAGRSPVKRIDRFDPSPFRSQVAAQVDDFDPLAWMPPKTARQLDRFSQFGLVAGTLALNDGRMRPGEDGAASPERIGIYLGSALGGIVYAEEQHERYLEKGIRQVAPNLALAVFGGGVEIPLSPLAFGAFDIIRALSGGSNDDPEHACRPFDAKRDGFVMGEGAALLVLEAEDVVRARQAAEPYAEVLGYGATSDAYHMVQPRADGSEAARAASIAMADAGGDPEAIDFVSAHAS